MLEDEGESEGESERERKEKAKEKGKEMPALRKDGKKVSKREAIVALSQEASREASAKKTLESVLATWEARDLPIVQHGSRSASKCFILGSMDEINDMMDDTRIRIITLSSSRSASHLEQEISYWVNKFHLASDTLEAWIVCQRVWLYLESVFSQQELRMQLPNETRVFGNADKAWKVLMAQTERSPRVLECLLRPGNLEVLQMCNAQFDQVKKCMEDYLDTRRRTFPRLYFLSNDELLDLFGNARNNAVVTFHIRKTFGNLDHLVFSPQDLRQADIIAVQSAEGEVLRLVRSVSTRSVLDAWLVGLEKSLKASVYDAIQAAVATVRSQPLLKWALATPSHVSCVALQIIFNEDVLRVMSSARTLRKKELADLQKRWAAQLDQLTHDFVHAELANVQRLVLQNLLITIMHCGQVVDTLVRNKIHRADDFLWLEQLRYAWERPEEQERHQLVVHQGDASTLYAYEYLGTRLKLVITPLTERCFFTMNLALKLNMGGCLAGPAGTGKTETIRELAATMGRMCIVFNCSKDLEMHLLGRLFGGILQSGVWCCFDEFNRIDTRVLSVVAEYLLVIKRAMDMNLTAVAFNGRDLKIFGEPAYFVTMNPTYAGRVELPENLRVLFRSVTVTAPDDGCIVESILSLHGLPSRDVLARRIIGIFVAARQTLSPQQHYDFGLRAIKAVLSAFLLRLRSSRSQLVPSAPVDITHLAEPLHDSLRDVIFPSLVANDTPLLECIVRDFFPELRGASPAHLDSKRTSISRQSLDRSAPLFDPSRPSTSNTQQTRASVSLDENRLPTTVGMQRRESSAFGIGNIRPPTTANPQTRPSTTAIQSSRPSLLTEADEVWIRAASDLALEPDWSQLEKAKQLSRALSLRQGVVVLGESMTGKSSVCRLVARAARLGAFGALAGVPKSSADSALLSTSMASLSIAREVGDVEIRTVNPKALSPRLLMGHFSERNHEWQDGVAPSILRKFAMAEAHGVADSVPPKVASNVVDATASGDMGSQKECPSFRIRSWPRMACL